MFSITVVFLSAVLCCVAEKCIEDCQEPILLYDDLKCNPVFSNENNCCPVEYNCSHIEERALNKKNGCYFHGKYYKLDEQIDSSETYGNCMTGCTCIEDPPKKIRFICAMPGCIAATQFGCYVKHGFDECCGLGEACPPFNATCQVGNKTYHEGQKFDPLGIKCTKCICQAGFEGKYEEPFCRKIRCLEELRNGRDIERFCAPVYYDITNCCPFKWICPESSDFIISAATSPAHASAKCKFGSKAMNIGDKLTGTTNTGSYFSCECRIPPYLTCFQNLEHLS